MDSFIEIINQIPNTIYSRDPDSDIIKLFTLYSESFDELKSVIDDLSELKEIQIQTGAVLDEIGKIVKESRRNLMDEEYRGFLHIAIQRNRSSGSLKTISQLVRLVIQTTDYTIRDLHNAKDTTFDGLGKFNGLSLLNPGTAEPAAFDVHVPDESDIEYINNLVQELKSAGVRSEVKYNSEI